MSQPSVKAIFAALDSYATALHPARGDDKSRHVSDLAMCDRATWARLNDKLPKLLTDEGQPKNHDADTLRKFTLGFAVEEHVLDALVAAGNTVERGVRVAFIADAFGISGGRVLDTYVPASHVIVGHPDGVGNNCVYEVKSTEFMMDRKTWKRIVPTTEAELQHHYRLQVAAYALALKKEWCVVIIVCRASGLVSVVIFPAESYRQEIMERSEALANIGTAMPEPTLHPSTINTKGVSWLCKYCPFTACVLNKKEAH